jgi:hypothetical protein
VDGGASSSKANSNDVCMEVINLGDNSIEKKGPAKKKKQDLADVTRRWQDVWVARFLWVEGPFEEGKLVGVKCIACSTINGRPKLIVAKLDNLEKHEGKRVVVLNNVKCGLKKNDIYHDKECSHLRNMSLFAARRPESMLELVNEAAAGKNRRKRVQYSAIFSILQHGPPMCDYSSSRFLLEHLKVKHLPTKHWCESLGWKMAHYMHLSVLAALARAVQAARIISVTADEVTGVDNTQWLSIHV